MLKQITNPAVDDAIKSMIAVAEDIAGCHLTKIHEYSIDVHNRLKSALSPMVYDLIESLAGENDYIQAVPNIRIHLPGKDTAIPFHSDLLYGHSQHETNYWMVLTPAFGTNSLWMCDDRSTGFLHDFLKSGASLDQFQETAKLSATPIQTETPGLFTFCCADVHGSVKNTTDSTRVSFDIRTIPADAPVGVKRRGSYFRNPRIKSRNSSEIEMYPGNFPTVATLDYSTPVYLQRQIMQKFFPFPPLTELVEFHGLNEHAPTLEAKMDGGPVIAYSVRQLRRMRPLKYPIGFGDESMWFSVGDEDKLELFWKQCR